MTEQMNVPELRFGEFEEQLFLRPFGDLVTDVTYGPRFNADDYSVEGNVRTIRGTDMGNNGEIKYAQVPTAQLDEKTVSRHELKHGDLVMITTADCGVTSVYREQNIKHICSAYAVKIELNRGADSTYFKYFFQTRKAQYEVSRFIRRATVSNLPGSDIKRIRQSPPTLPEQQKIASFLSKVDEKIGLLSEKKDKLTEYKKGVMQQLFNGKWHEQDGRLTFVPPTLRFKADDGSEFPDWEERSLSEVATLQSGYAFSSDLFSQAGEMLITPKNFSKSGNALFTKKNTKYTQEKTDKKYLCKGGDLLLLLTDLTPDCRLLGKPVLLEGGTEVLLNQRIVKFNITANELLKKSYIFQYFLTQKWNNRMRITATGTTVRHSSNRIVLNTNLAMPCIGEQAKIANFLSTIDKKIELANSELNKAKEWKKGLLQQMFV
ncbi:restriction endonuclease subunit S [Vibrio splendidus]